jgi:DNA-binding CsgD family transcriptional regulator
MMALTGHRWRDLVRLVSRSPISTVFTPRVSAPQLRRLLRLGILLRWVSIGFAGLAGLMVPRAPSLLFYLILAAVVYNSAITLAAARATDERAKSLVLAATIVDQVFTFTFIAIYSSALPQGGQVACYFFGVLEAVAYYQATGAVLSVGIFAGLSLVETAYLYMTHGFLSPTDVIGVNMIVALTAGSLVAVNRVLQTPDQGAEVDPALRLSKREREVLALVAEGYSNPMIAAHLHLSDNTVKGYMENLLTRLNARNRAEAVAAASRLKLI